MHFIVPKRHSWEGKKSVSISELAHEDYIAFSPECSLRQGIDGILKRLNIQPRIVYEASSDHVIASRVASGFGIGIVLESLSVSNMELSTVPIAEQRLFNLNLYLLWSVKKPLSPATTEFYNHIIAFSRSFNSAE